MLGYELDDFDIFLAYVYLLKIKYVLLIITYFFFFGKEVNFVLIFFIKIVI